MSERDSMAVDPQAAARPGERHLAADLDVAKLLTAETRSLARAPLTDAVRSPTGCASLGMLVTLIDIGASDPAMAACRPDWTATQDLAIHGAGGLTEGPIVVDSRLVRVGKRVVVVATDIYDGHGLEDFDDLLVAIGEAGRRSDVGGGPTLAASALVTFARISRSAAPGMDGYDPASWVGQIRHDRVDPPVVGTMYEWMGLKVVDGPSGQVELARTPYVVNSIGTINGGAQAVLVEAAAEAMRPGMAATDVQIHYLSQVKVGPARTLGSVLRDAAGHSVVSMKVIDAGNDDQLLALATVTLQGVGR